MVEIVSIPKLGLSDYGELVSWEVSIGERVQEGDVVAVLESDKASAEIESAAAGQLLETYVTEGEEIEIEVGKPLAVVGDDGERIPSLDELKSEDAGSAAPAQANESGEPNADETTDDGPKADVKATPRAKRRAREADVALTEVSGTGPQGAITSDDIEDYLHESDADDSETVKATPRAKRRARDEAIDLADVDGTGPEQAVTEGDVEAHLDATDAAEEPDDGLTVTESRELTGTRKTIARRLSQSSREKPHVLGTREISIENLERACERLQEEYGVDVSLNDVLLHLIGDVLAELPAFNAHFDDGEHKLIEEVNIGYAVDGPRGLTVPVIETVTEKSLPELADSRRRKVNAVLDDDHDASDLTGGTFTVTNVGVFGMDTSFSIINPPEVAILSIGRRKYAPVERESGIEFEKVITFSLTIDHRVLDGADSGAFLEKLAEAIEFPGSIFERI